MNHRMDDLVGRRQDVETAAGKRPQPRFQQCVVGTGTAGHWRNGVMQIHLEGVPGDPHRRQFVAPFAVVALVVGIGLLCLPSGSGENRLGGIEIAPRHQQIDVVGHATLRERKILGDVGGALEQHDGHAGGQCGLEVAEFDANHLQAVGSKVDRRAQVAVHGLGHRRQQRGIVHYAVSEDTEQTSLPCQTQGAVPIGQRHRSQMRDVGEQRQQMVLG